MAPNLIVNPIVVYQGYDGVTQAISNWVPTTDGRYMCCWLDPITYQLVTGYCTNLNFLSTNYAITSIIVTPDIVTNGVPISDGIASLYKRVDGKVLLFVVSEGLDSWCRCYISNNGNGDDWIFYSLVAEFVADNGASTSGHANIPVKLATGRLIISVEMKSNNWISSYNFPTGVIAYSDNDGLNWSIAHQVAGSDTYGIGQICQLPDGGLFCVWTSGSGTAYLLRSLDNGITWTQVASWDTTFANSGLHGWAISFYYDPITSTVYAQSTMDGEFIAYLENPTSENFSNITAWTVLLTGVLGKSRSGSRIYMMGGYLVFHDTAYLYSSIPSAPISKTGRHAIYCIKDLDQKIRIRNARTLDTGFTRLRNLKHKAGTDIWGGATL